ncbi:MAG TPA: LamG domain-containing protein, partial [Gaiellaceae bacterium]|nr:LamG domain-containing protein [Gaiellaceae bacterium]
MAGSRTFTPERATADGLTFNLRGLEPAAVRSATLRAPRVRRHVPLSTIRRAARRGLLRVRASRVTSHAAGARVARVRDATTLTVTTCTSSSSSYTAAVAATSGLVSHWRLGESSGSVACDEVQRNAGTYASGTAFGQAGATTDGNPAAGFGGTARVTVASNASLAPGAGVSVEAWIKPTSTVSQTVVRKDGQYLLRLSGGTLVARVWRASGSYVEVATAPVVQTSAFQHVALTYDRSTLRVYRNGTQVAAKSASGTPAGSSKALLVGSSDGYDGFRGTLDEVAVYSQALTASQLAAHVSAAGQAAPTPTPTPEPTPTPSPTPAPTPEPDPTCSDSLTSFGVGSWPGGCWRPYLSTSFFNKPVPDSPKVHPNSAAMITRMLSAGSGPGNLTAGEPAIDDYKHPIVYSGTGDPEYVVHCTKWACDDLEGKRVRIPVGARPAGGSD